MPDYKIGCWVRIFVSAPSAEDAHRVRLLAHKIQFGDAVAIAPGDAPVEIDTVEVEWADIVEYDAEGAEVRRWDADGEHLIED